MKKNKKDRPQAPLTAKAIQDLAPETKSYKVADGKGLYILVTPKGSKLWRYNYRFQGKQKTLALGEYDIVTLKMAREMRDEARSNLIKGVDPSEKKRASKYISPDSTFGAIALEWLEHKYKHDVEKDQFKRTRRRLETYILPYIGEMEIGSISTANMLTIIRPIEKLGKIDTAKRVRTICVQVFNYAGASGRAERNPADMIKGAVLTPRPKHHPSRTDPSSVSDLLRTIYGEGNLYRGRLLVREALIFGSMLFFRPGEIRNIKWSQINLDKAQLTHTPSKRRTGTGRIEVIVPLPHQLVSMLRHIKPLSQGTLAQGGDGDYVFPGAVRGRPMSENTLNQALRWMGIDTKTDFTGHGFRAMARTMIREQLKSFRDDVIEMALSHTVRDPLGRAYNRTDLLDERREMLQAWADYLDQLRSTDQRVQ